MNKKAHYQIDFIFLMLIMVLIYYSFSTFTNDYFKIQNHVVEQERTQFLAKDVCNLLTKSSGYPTNWQYNLKNIKILGLKNLNNNSLNTEKIQIFTNTHYDDLINALIGLNYSEYIYNIKVKGIKTNTTYLNFGYPIDSGFKYLSNYICFSNYNNESVEVLVEVWK